MVGAAVAMDRSGGGALCGGGSDGVCVDSAARGADEGDSGDADAGRCAWDRDCGAALNGGAISAAGGAGADGALAPGDGGGAGGSTVSRAPRDRLACDGGIGG